MTLTSEQRIEKMTALAIMLDKLSELYPKFADKVYWEDAHELLAEFWLPEEERGVVEKMDRYYITVVADHLRIPFDEVFQGFSRASQLKELESQ